MEEKIDNIELIQWKSDEEWKDSFEREKIDIRSLYETYDEVTTAIDELGPISASTDRANVYFGRLAEPFEDGIEAVRQSGLNVRRIWISREYFEIQYGNFQGCIDHVLSNNCVGPELESVRHRL